MANGVDASQADAGEPQKPQRVATFASTAVQCGAALLLGGGFYYGVAQQKRAVKEEKLLPAGRANDKAPVIRSTTFLERRLALDRQQTPNAAARKALVGGTIVSVSGCFVLVCGLAAVLGVRSLTEFRERMESAMPRMRKNVTRALHIKPKQHTFENEEEEMRELAAIFAEEAEEKPVKPAKASTR